MVGYDGLVRIIDLGIAKFDGKRHRTVVGDIPGTQGFIAPELDGAKEATERSDLYSVGACLWFLLTGLRFFDAGVDNEGKELLALRLKERGRDDVPAGMLTFLWRLLHKSPAARYDSANEAASVLEANVRLRRTARWRASSASCSRPRRSWRPRTSLSGKRGSLGAPRRRPRSCGACPRPTASTRRETSPHDGHHPSGRRTTKEAHRRRNHHRGRCRCGGPVLHHSAPAGPRRRRRAAAARRDDASARGDTTSAGRAGCLAVAGRAGSDDAISCAQTAAFGDPHRQGSQRRRPAAHPSDAARQKLKEAGELAGMGRTKLAKQSTSSSSRIRARDRRRWWASRVSLTAMGDYEDAVRIATDAAKGGGGPDALMVRASAYLARRESDKAQADFDRVLTMQPKNLDAAEGPQGCGAAQEGSP